MTLLERTIGAAEQAGRLIEAVRARTMVSVATKADSSPVTEADRAADTWLHAALLDIRACAWLSEETADSPSRLGAEELWIVDPLDGTKEFLRGIAEYVVAVAMVQGGEPVIGVVHNPSTRETFSAECGAGAFDASGNRLRIAEGDALLSSRTEVRAGEFAEFDGPFRLIAKGSIQYKLALIAQGKAAATLSRGPKHEWDVCAGALLVTEAGGVATDLFGRALRYNQPFPKVRGVLAGAPDAVARAATIVARVGPSERMREFDTTDHRSPR